MSEITIDLPEWVHAELAARAARRGQSLEDFVLALVMELSNRPEPEAD